MLKSHKRYIHLYRFNARDLKFRLYVFCILRIEFYKFEEAILNDFGAVYGQNPKMAAFLAFSGNEIRNSQKQNFQNCNINFVNLHTENLSE